MESSTRFLERTSRFYGRETDLENIAASLNGPDRLLTIVGPGGMGKTRLAMEAARAERRRAGDAIEGPWFCDLGEALTAANICACFASALEVTLAGSSVDAQVIQLGYALASRPRALVVFDNFEQIVEHAPTTLLRWLSMAADARFLVTSRERLRIAGEVVFELESLALPQTGDDPLASDAVRLFLDRTRGGSVVRDLTSNDTECVAEIVRRLDGMPLAIELAASRASLLSPASLLARLARPLDVLSLGRRGAVSRHATITSTIAWSWSLLGPHEQQTLAQCSVFSGGFTLEAAEEILALSPTTAGERPAVLDALQALRDASLLRAYAAPGVSAETRYGLFETIRQFAHQELVASGGLPAAMRRHAAYYLREGLAWAEGLLGPEGAHEMRRLELERHNLVAIARRATAIDPPSARAANDAITAMRILEPPALSGLAEDRNGLLEPSLRYADAVVPPSPAADATDAEATGIDRSRWAHCWIARGRSLYDKGAIPEALEAQERALALAREASDGRAEGSALVCIAGYLLRGANHERTWRFACAATQRALDFHYDADERGRAYVMACQTALSSVFAQYSLDGGSVDRMLELGERTLDLLRRSGNRLMEKTIELTLGVALATAGLLTAAQAHCERALLICPEFAITWVSAATHAALGAIAFEREEAGRAAEELQLAIPLARRSGAKLWEGHALTLLGMVHHHALRTTEARETLERAIAVLRVCQWPIGLGVALGALAMVAAAELRLDEAEDLLRRSEEHLAPASRDPDSRIADLLPGFLEVARATLAADGGDDAGALIWLDKARARPDTAVRSEKMLRPSQGVRLVARMLERAIDSFMSRTRALLVGAEASWFQPPGGARVQVFSKSPRLLLLHLAEARTLRPGTSVGREELFRSAWPGERAGHEAIANRVGVAIAALRKLGLGGLIVTDEDRWLLDPSVPLIRLPR